MSEVRIAPGPVHGSLRSPPSKSYTHRALVAAHLAGRAYTIYRPLRSNDTLRTVAALGVLGSRVTRYRERWVVVPAPAPPHRRRLRVDCGESGTTLRFASALAALGDRTVELVGRGRLPDRPMGSLANALRTLGAAVESTDPPHALPMTVRGPLHGGPVEVDASESSQFVSALLLALPTRAEDSRIRLPSSPVSKPYIDATLSVLRASGIRVTEGPSGYRVPGRQRYRGRSFRVPGDASSAAYLWASAAIAGGSVSVEGLPDRWPQADLAILDLLERYGATVDRRRGGTRVAGGRRRPFAITLTDSPDLYPLAGVLAASVPGISHLRGASHVAAKESDRRAETIRLVRALGGAARPVGGDLEIRGSDSLRPLVLEGAQDHRVVMSAAVAALGASGPSTVGDSEAVNKSFPDFWKALARLTGRRRHE